MTLSCSLFTHTFPVARLRIPRYVSAAHRGAGSQLWIHTAHACLYSGDSWGKSNGGITASGKATHFNWSLQGQNVNLSAAKPRRSPSWEPTAARNSVLWAASGLTVLPPAHLLPMEPDPVSTGARGINDMAVWTQALGHQHFLSFNEIQAHSSLGPGLSDNLSS